MGNLADDRLVILFLISPETGFDISYLHWRQLAWNQILLSVENKNNISKCRLLKILPIFICDKLVKYFQLGNISKPVISINAMKEKTVTIVGQFFCFLLCQRRNCHSENHSFSIAYDKMRFC